MKRSPGAWAASALLLASVLSCGSDRALAPVRLDRLAISGRDSLLLGDTATMIVIAYDALGDVIPTPTVTWSSEAPEIATVSSAGLVTGVATGSTVIRATAGSFVAAREEIVEGRRLALIPLPEFGDTIRLAPGQAIRLFAYEYDLHAAPAPPSQPVAWTSSRDDLATVSDSGVVTAVASGVAQITATADGVHATQTIAIAPTPGTVSVRFVNANYRLPRVTLAPDAGTPVDLAYLDVAEGTMPAGTLQVLAPAYPPAEVELDWNWLDAQQFTGFLSAGSRATIVVTSTVDGPAGGSLVFAPIWDWTGPIGPDSVMIRVMLVTTAGYNVYYTDPGAPVHTIALQGCYLDYPYGVNNYSARWAGPFDIVLQGSKDLYSPPSTRITVTPAPGRATTYILSGEDVSTLRVVAVVDP